MEHNPQGMCDCRECQSALHDEENCRECNRVQFTEIDLTQSFQRGYRKGYRAALEDIGKVTSE